MKNTTLLIISMMLGLFMIDAPTNHMAVPNPFSGRQTFRLEGLSSMAGRVDGEMRKAVLSSAGADYYICTESGGGTGNAVLIVFEPEPLP